MDPGGRAPVGKERQPVNQLLVNVDLVGSCGHHSINDPQQEWLCECHELPPRARCHEVLWLAMTDLLPNAQVTEFLISYMGRHNCSYDDKSKDTFELACYLGAAA